MFLGIVAIPFQLIIFKKLSAPIEENKKNYGEILTFTILTIIFSSLIGGILSIIYFSQTKHSKTKNNKIIK